MNDQTETVEVFEGEIAVIDMKAFGLPAPTVFKESLEGAFAEMYHRIDEDLASRVVDLSTAKGRKQIAADAARISRLKVAMAAKAKELVSDQKAIIDTVTKTRLEMEAEFDSRRDKARLPLTEWEETGKLIEERSKAEKAFMLTIRAQSINGVLVADMTAAQLTAFREVREGMEFDSDQYGEAADDLAELNGTTLLWLDSAIRDTLRAEQDAAELEELRAMKAEKVAREEAEAAAAAEKAEQEAAEAQQKADQDAAADRQVKDLGEFVDTLRPNGKRVSECTSVEIGATIEWVEEMQFHPDDTGPHNAKRIQQARAESVSRLLKLQAEVKAKEDEAAEAARIEVERAEAARVEALAKAAQVKADAEAAERIAAAEAKAAAEIQRAKVEAEGREAAREKAEADRKAAEAKALADQAEIDRKRAEDQDHRRARNGEILKALTELDLTIDQAKAVIVAINQGRVPHTKIGY